MKKLYKIMLAALFSILCFVPLSVSAEQSTTFGISNGELDFTDVLTCDQFSYFVSNISSHVYGTISLKNDYLILFFYPYQISNDVIYYNKYSSWDTRNNSFTTYNVSSNTWRITNSILLFNDVGSITGSSAYSNWDSYNLSSFISSNNNACGLFPSKACPVEVLNVLSNPNVLSLLNSYALGKASIVDWNIYSITQSSGGTALPICQSSGFDYLGSRIGYEIQVSTDGSTFTSFYSWTFYKDGYAGGSSGSACLWTKDTSWDLVSRSLILSKSCYDSVANSVIGPIEVNDSKNNQLLENGNSSTQSASSSIDSVTNSFNSTASQYEQFETQFNSSLTSSLDNIDVNSINLVNSNDFVKTAAWVKVQFDDILDNSGIYKTAISFVLIIGLALLLLGRRL